jgi:hypothetical protein
MSLEYPDGTEVTCIPANRAEEYNGWMRQLNQAFPDAEPAIRGALNEYVDSWLLANGANPHAAFCSSWIPGATWDRDGSQVYRPLYDAMLLLYGDQKLAFTRAGWFFGLILLDVMSHREDVDWVCWHDPRQRFDDEPEGMYYRPKVSVAA